MITTDRHMIQVTGRSVLIFGSIGVVLYLVMGICLLHVQEYPITPSGFRKLFEDFNVFHLTGLIPVILLMTGFFEGRRNYRDQKQLKETIQHQSSNINETIEFAREIGSGNLEYNFVPVNGEKQLGRSLDEMRKSLLSASQRETERNEIMKMVGQVGKLLRNNNELEKLSEEVIAYLVRELDNVVQGAIYVVDEAGEKLEMKSSYAYNRKKHMDASFHFAQGLVGQAAVEKQAILRKEIPEDYMTITSGLIEHKKPNSLLFEPLITNEEVFGVIELASFGDFTPMQLNLMDDLSEIIARTLSNVRINKKTVDLLQESQHMSDELGEQKKQLMEQAEEMISTQEELRTSNIKLEEQIEEVHNSQKKNHILLENASEIITIYSEKGKATFVSPSIKAITGYFPEEITGKHASENVHPQETDAINSFFEDLISFPEQTRTLQYRYFTKQGDIAWLEATGKNLLADPVIRGIVVNSRDISVQILAEKEQRMRAKMQALSENSLDIIVRVDIFSRCTYINPVIESYTGLKPEDFIDKPLMDIEFDQEVLTSWKQIFEAVARDREKRTSEIVFALSGEKKIMTVNAIPEFYESGEIESVLMVCHDITDAKQREELIKLKNKSISDSINYAYYIQSSLMPKEEDIRSFLPNSFMFYKPKDVVSGDYPWLHNDGDNIYIGAMDCTGHGVPGALMSLIGHFSQNDIVVQNRGLNAGELLDHLHTSVVKTLRQEEEDSVTKDGMDAAFCRINLKKKELHFAGAHRPLYYVSNGNLEVIKGDKFPVGGNQHGTRKQFTNHEISIKPGDAIYIMTDGFPDQYGGPTGKQKYMSGRVKLLIADHTHLSVFQMGNLFRDTFYDWKGETKQLDDVLIIGVKF